jgi:hypothetical protein
VERRRGGRKQSGRVVSFGEQVALFLSDYPGGFADPAWIRDARGDNTGRKTTRHREPAIERARSLLNAEELGPLVDEDKHEEVIARAQQAIEGCSLVSASQGALLSSVHPSKQRVFAVSLYEWLHGDDVPARHFDRLVASLEGPKRSPSWPLVTAFAALVHPEDHVCVKPSVFQQQAKVLAPNLVLQRRPNHAQYELMCTLSDSITDELKARELTPQDRLDLHDFIWATIRPAAVTRIEAIRAAATEAPAV